MTGGVGSAGSLAASSDEERPTYWPGTWALPSTSRVEALDLAWGPNPALCPRGRGLGGQQELAVAPRYHGGTAGQLRAALVRLQAAEMAWAWQSAEWAAGRAALLARAHRTGEVAPPRWVPDGGLGAPCPGGRGAMDLRHGPRPPPRAGSGSAGPTPDDLEWYGHRACWWPPLLASRPRIPRLLWVRFSPSWCWVCRTCAAWFRHWYDDIMPIQYHH